MTWEAPEGYEERVRSSFARQGAMALLGASLHRIAPGLVEIALPFRPDLTQQDGFFHAGVQGAIADSAGGYAAYTLMPSGSRVLSVEYRLHLLRPADGERLLARGKVVRPGKTLTVCELSVEVLRGGAATQCAYGTQTLIRVAD